MVERGENDSPESDKGFTVSDRRHWVRDQAEESSPAGAKKAPPAPEAEAPPELEQPPEVPPEAPYGELPPADFNYLVVFLATQALLCLGEQPDPTTGEKMEKNLPGAKHAIELLSVIQDKTKGNLNDEERQLLEGVLYDLRMRYVQAAGPEAS